jgi:hypothetical protein
MDSNMGNLASTMPPMTQGLGMSNLNSAMAAPSQLISNQQMMSHAM